MMDVWLLRLWGLFGKGMHVIGKQVVSVDDPFGNEDRIVDLGGGGEGVIGRLRGKQVVAVDIRKDELDDTPNGPTKVVADAKALPFPDGSFDAATAFFFLMYVPGVDRPAVMREAHRVLRPGGTLHIWDAAIPAPAGSRRELFVVPLRIILPDRKIGTAYGVRWKGHDMSCGDIVTMALEAGFALAGREETGGTFHLVLTRLAVAP